jgi:hypothetical protein
MRRVDSACGAPVGVGAGGGVTPAVESTGGTAAPAADGTGVDDEAADGDEPYVGAGADA